MSAGWGALVLVSGVVGAAVWAVLGDACREEARNRLVQLPHALVRLAARRLPEELREDLADEWGAELTSILRATEGFPLTRLWRGTWFAGDLFLRGARAIAREAGECGRDYADMPERTLVRLAGAGDHGAWHELVGRHTGLLWSIARGFRLDPADAADAVQQTWLGMVENLDRIRPNRLRVWLFLFMRHVCLGMTPCTSPSGDRESRTAERGPDVPAQEDVVGVPAGHQHRFTVLRLLMVMIANPPPALRALSISLDTPFPRTEAIRTDALPELRRLFAEREPSRWRRLLARLRHRR